LVEDIQVEQLLLHRLHTAPLRKYPLVQLLQLLAAEHVRQGTTH